MVPSSPCRHSLPGHWWTHCWFAYLHDSSYSHYSIYSFLCFSRTRLFTNSLLHLFIWSSFIPLLVLQMLLHVLYVRAQRAAQWSGQPGALVAGSRCASSTKHTELKTEPRALFLHFRKRLTAPQYWTAGFASRSSNPTELLKDGIKAIYEPHAWPRTGQGFETTALQRKLIPSSAIQLFEHALRHHVPENEKI